MCVCGVGCAQDRKASLLQGPGWAESVCPGGKPGNGKAHPAEASPPSPPPQLWHFPLPPQAQANVRAFSFENKVFIQTVQGRLARCSRARRDVGGAGVGKGREAGWAGSTRLQCGAWPQELTTYIPAERKAVRDAKQRETFACFPTPQPLPGCPSPEHLHHSLPVGQPCALFLDSTPGERDLAPGPHLLSPSP